MKLAFSLPLTCLLLIATISTGCRTYTQRNANANTHWRRGEVQMAAQLLTTAADAEKDNKDALILRLEQGTALHAAGKFKESLEAFDRADQYVDKFDEGPKVSLSREAGATLSNQDNLPYDGKSYDKIMLSTYKALNYMHLGDFEKARVELLRAGDRQDQAKEYNEKRVAKMQEEAEAKQEKDKEKIEKAKQDERYKQQVETNMMVLDELKLYADYVNPFTTYLEGLFFLAQPQSPTDLERASKSFEIAQRYIGENPFLQQDREVAQQIIEGKTLSPTTYVIFETGRAPMRGQIRIDIPIIVTSVSYVGASIPKLEPQPDYVNALTVKYDATNETATALLASMDSVVARDFKDELPTIITKTMISTVTKAAVAYGVNEGARQAGGNLVGFATRVATAVTQAAMNIADTRTWTTLPKEFQYCRIPTPVDRKLQIIAGGQIQEITLGEGLINLVYVKSVAPQTPLFVSQLKLK